MENTFSLHEQPCTIVLTVETDRPIEFRAYGASGNYLTRYFDRIVRLQKGKHQVEFPLPLAPETLRLVFEGDYKDARLSFVRRPLETSPLFLSNEDKDFIELAEYIAEHLVLLQVGKVYTSPKTKKFRVYVVPHLVDRKTGERSGSPARIHFLTKIAEISYSQFLKFTVPMRMFILLHEYMHVKLMSKDEEEVDESALRIYKGLGYSSLEAVYAFTKVLDLGNSALNKRANRIYHQLESL